MPTPGAARVIFGGDADGEEGDACLQGCTGAKTCTEGGMEACMHRTPEK